MTKFNFEKDGLRTVDATNKKPRLQPLRNFEAMLIQTFLLCLLAGITTLLPAAQQAPPPSAPAPEIPVMDGGAGPCSLDLTVTADGKPVYAANIKVHIAYGFGGVRRLDLEAYTNEQGKVKFTGLPDRVKKPPLEFRAAKGELTGMATYDPKSECHTRHDIALNQKSNAQN